jgi:hypothetical protein
MCEDANIAFRGKGTVIPLKIDENGKTSRYIQTPWGAMEYFKQFNKWA